jgi:lipoate-protein ligase A
MEDMVAALKVPEAKLKKRELDSASQRVVTLRELLGADLPPLETIKAAMTNGFAESLGIDPQPGAITKGEEAESRRYHDEEIGTEAFVAEIDEPGAGEGVLSASHTGSGGTLSAYLRLEGPRGGRVRELLLTGDFFVTPPKTIFDLEASLRGQPVSGIGDAVMQFFETAPVDLSTIAPDDFRRVIEAALATR